SAQANVPHAALLCFLHTARAPSAFFFTDPAPPKIYTLSLHDALPIYPHPVAETSAIGIGAQIPLRQQEFVGQIAHAGVDDANGRSEEHTSELQSLAYLVCRLLLEKKKLQRPSIHPLA